MWLKTPRPLNYLEMKILAVHPLYPGNTEIVYLPMGLAIVCAVAERQGHEVTVLDMHNLKLPYAALERELQRSKFDICLMGGFAMQVKHMRYVTQLIREIQPQCQVILGGVGVSVIPDIVLEYTKADAVSLGEAELTFPDALRSIENGHPFEETVGFAYHHNGKIIHSPKGPVPQDLDEIPWPAYHLFDTEYISRYSYNGRNGRSIHIMTSRGCPFRCDFCINSVLNDRHILQEIHGEIVEEGPPKSQRFRSTQSLIKEINYLRSTYGINDFYFADEEFITHRRRLEEVCGAIEPLGISWSTSGRADWATEEKLSRMKKAGCQYVFFGVETGSQKMMDMMNKNAKKEAVSLGLQSARKVEMNFIANFMIGHAGETEQTVRETIEFCKEHKLIYLPSYVTLFPNSKMFHEASKTIQDWDFYFDWLSKIDYSRNYFYNLTDLPRKKIVALRTWGVAETLMAALVPKAPKPVHQLGVVLFQTALTLMDHLPSFLRRVIRNFFRYTFEFIWLKEKATSELRGKKTSRQIAANDVGQELPDSYDTYEESLAGLKESEASLASSKH